MADMNQREFLKRSTSLSVALLAAPAIAVTFGHPNSSDAVRELMEQRIKNVERTVANSIDELFYGDVSSTLKGFGLAGLLDAHA